MHAHAQTSTCSTAGMRLLLHYDIAAARLRAAANSHVVADVALSALHAASARLAMENVVSRPRRFPPCLPAQLYVCVRALLCVYAMSVQSFSHVALR